MSCFLNKVSYYSLKVFLRLWLAKIPRIIHDNQPLLTKLEEVCDMWKITSILQHNCQKTGQLAEKTWGRGWVLCCEYKQMVFWYLALSNNCLLFLHLNFWCLLTVSSENGYVGTYQVSVWSFPAFQASQERGNKAGVTEALRTLGKIVFFNSVWEVTWGVKPFYRCLPHHFISFTSSLHEFEVLVSAIFVTFIWLERRKWGQCCTYWDDRVV